MNVSEIWHILNEHVSGTIPVYELAHACKGLPKETIYELGEKMQNDIHELGFDRKKYKKFINQKQFDRRIKGVKI